MASENGTQWALSGIDAVLRLAYLTIKAAFELIVNVLRLLFVRK